jgi:hypothetical protein
VIEPGQDVRRGNFACGGVTHNLASPYCAGMLRSVMNSSELILAQSRMDRTVKEKKMQKKYALEDVEPEHYIFVIVV